MMKRSVFLALAAGMIASVAFTAPAKAGSTLVTTTAVFQLSPATATTTEIDIFYQNGVGGPLTGAISDLTIVNTGTLLGVVLTPIGTSEVKVTFTAKNSTDGSLGPPPTPGLQFTFTTGSPVGDVFLSHADIVLLPGTSAAQSVSVASSAVPEPASVALLGIGMTGFLAFRRFFKRTSVA